ncbi:FMN-binding protein [Fusobacterium gastrosuis]|uniref:FMN-binding protein n=1 Tax=Fusobacterium gastrosuis TaxID=1755100 RepID=UPI002976965F|nr:FMN-binding protein [Fusobacteriaceae bacterium]MDY5713868.1 FMN-binding protein [Fusobacterium gastrosuis]
MVKKSLKKIMMGALFLSLATGVMGAEKLYQGLGKSSNFRVGPGKDNKGTPVYSLNYVTAAGVFDEKGKIVNIYVDILELSTPNYPGATASHFSGWPGAEGYNVVDHDSREVIGVSMNTVETATKEVENWVTKRERGKSYGMNWTEQMDFFQEFFKGKTVEEIEAWFAKNASDVNGRPLKADSKNEKDQEKYAKLTETEKEALVDVVAGATMSIRDNHGDILGAIKDAYKNRVEIKK